MMPPDDQPDSKAEKTIAAALEKHRARRACHCPHIRFAAPDEKLPYLLVDWRDASEFVAAGARTVASADLNELLLTAEDFVFLAEAEIKP
jgi:hypothetical protein